jgi:hypothetical protein
MEKLNLTLTLAGTAASVREPINKAEVKSRKGTQISQTKISQEIQITGISWDEWKKRRDAAVAILTGGKISKAPASVDKRLADAEAQIADLTEKLQQQQAEAKMPKAKTTKK